MDNQTRPIVKKFMSDRLLVNYQNSSGSKPIMISPRVQTSEEIERYGQINQLRKDLLIESCQGNSDLQQLIHERLQLQKKNQEDYQVKVRLQKKIMTKMLSSKILNLNSSGMTQQRLPQMNRMIRINSELLTQTQMVSNLEKLNQKKDSTQDLNQIDLMLLNKQGLGSKKLQSLTIDAQLSQEQLDQVNNNQLNFEPFDVIGPQITGLLLSKKGSEDTSYKNSQNIYNDNIYQTEQMFDQAQIDSANNTQENDKANLLDLNNYVSLSQFMIANDEGNQLPISLIPEKKAISYKKGDIIDNLYQASWKKQRLQVRREKIKSMKYIRRLGEKLKDVIDNFNKHIKQTKQQEEQRQQKEKKKKIRDLRIQKQNHTANMVSIINFNGKKDSQVQSNSWSPEKQQQMMNQKQNVKEPSQSSNCILYAKNNFKQSHSQQTKLESNQQSQNINESSKNTGNNNKTSKSKSKAAIQQFNQDNIIDISLSRSSNSLSEEEVSNNGPKIQAINSKNFHDGSQRKVIKKKDSSSFQIITVEELYKDSQKADSDDQSGPKGSQRLKMISQVSLPFNDQEKQRLRDSLEISKNKSSIEPQQIQISMKLIEHNNKNKSDPIESITSNKYYSEDVLTQAEISSSQNQMGQIDIFNKTQKRNSILNDLKQDPIEQLHLEIGFGQMNNQIQLDLPEEEYYAEDSSLEDEIEAEKAIITEQQEFRANSLKFNEKDVDITKNTYQPQFKNLKKSKFQTHTEPSSIKIILEEMNDESSSNSFSIPLRVKSLSSEQECPQITKSVEDESYSKYETQFDDMTEDELIAFRFLLQQKQTEIMRRNSLSSVDEDSEIDIVDETLTKLTLNKMVSNDVSSAILKFYKSSTLNDGTIAGGYDKQPKEGSSTSIQRYNASQLDYLSNAEMGNKYGLLRIKTMKIDTSNLGGKDHSPMFKSKNSTQNIESNKSKSKISKINLFDTQQSIDDIQEEDSQISLVDNIQSEKNFIIMEQDKELSGDISDDNSNAKPMIEIKLKNLSSSGISKSYMNSLSYPSPVEKQGVTKKTSVENKYKDSYNSHNLKLEMVEDSSELVDSYDEEAAQFFLDKKPKDDDSQQQQQKHESDKNATSEDDEPKQLNAHLIIRDVLSIISQTSFEQSISMQTGSIKSSQEQTSEQNSLSRDDSSKQSESEDNYEKNKKKKRKQLQDQLSNLMSPKDIDLSQSSCCRSLEDSSKEQEIIQTMPKRDDVFGHDEDLTDMEIFYLTEIEQQCNQELLDKIKKEESQIRKEIATQKRKIAYQQFQESRGGPPASPDQKKDPELEKLKHLKQKLHRHETQKQFFAFNLYKNPVIEQSELQSLRISFSKASRTIESRSIRRHDSNQFPPDLRKNSISLKYQSSQKMIFQYSKTQLFVNNHVKHKSSMQNLNNKDELLENKHSRTIQEPKSALGFMKNHVDLRVDMQSSSSISISSQSLSSKQPGNMVVQKHFCQSFKKQSTLQNSEYQNQEQFKQQITLKLQLQEKLGVSSEEQNNEHSSPKFYLGVDSLHAQVPQSQTSKTIQPVIIEHDKKSTGYFDKIYNYNQSRENSSNCISQKSQRKSFEYKKITKLESNEQSLINMIPIGIDNNPLEQSINNISQDNQNVKTKHKDFSLMQESEIGSGSMVVSQNNILENMMKIVQHSNQASIMSMGIKPSSTIEHSQNMNIMYSNNNSFEFNLEIQNMDQHILDDNIGQEQQEKASPVSSVQQQHIQRREPRRGLQVVHQKKTGNQLSNNNSMSRPILLNQPISDQENNIAAQNCNQQMLNNFSLNQPIQQNNNYHQNPFQQVKENDQTLYSRNSSNNSFNTQRISEALWQSIKKNSIQLNKQRNSGGINSPQLSSQSPTQIMEESKNSYGISEQSPNGSIKLNEDQTFSLFIDHANAQQYEFSQNQMNRQLRDIPQEESTDSPLLLERHQLNDEVISDLPLIESQNVIRSKESVPQQPKLSERQPIHKNIVQQKVVISPLFQDKNTSNQSSVGKQLFRNIPIQTLNSPKQSNSLLSPCTMDKQKLKDYKNSLQSLYKDINSIRVRSSSKKQRIESNSNQTQNNYKAQTGLTSPISIQNMNSQQNTHHQSSSQVRQNLPPRPKFQLNLQSQVLQPQKYNSMQQELKPQFNDKPSLISSQMLYGNNPSYHHHGRNHTMQTDQIMLDSLTFPQSNEVQYQYRNPQPEQTNQSQHQHGNYWTSIDQNKYNQTSQNEDIYSYKQPSYNIQSPTYSNFRANFDESYQQMYEQPLRRQISPPCNSLNRSILSSQQNRDINPSRPGYTNQKIFRFDQESINDLDLSHIQYMDQPQPHFQQYRTSKANHMMANNMVPPQPDSYQSGQNAAFINNNFKQQIKLDLPPKPNMNARQRKSRSRNMNPVQHSSQTHQSTKYSPVAPDRYREKLKLALQRGSTMTVTKKGQNTNSPLPGCQNNQGNELYHSLNTSLNKQMVLQQQQQLFNPSVLRQMSPQNHSLQQYSNKIHAQSSINSQNLANQVNHDRMKTFKQFNKKSSMISEIHKNHMEFYDSER